MFWGFGLGLFQGCCLELKLSGMQGTQQKQVALRGHTCREAPSFAVQIHCTNHSTEDQGDCTKYCTGPDGILDV